MAEPTKAEVNRFVQVVDDFMREYDKLRSPETQAKVYGSGDSQLVADYETAINRGGALKGTILQTTGAWKNAKAAYQDAIDQSSMAIGDAIDWFREKYFGYDPAGGMGCANCPQGLHGLGALQLPAAAWIAGIVSAAYVLLRSFRALAIRIDAAALQRQNPNLSRDAAIKRASDAHGSGGLFSINTMPLLLGGLAALYFLTRG